VNQSPSKKRIAVTKTKIRSNSIESPSKTGIQEVYTPGYVPGEDE